MNRASIPRIYWREFKIRFNIVKMQKVEQFLKKIKEN